MTTAQKVDLARDAVRSFPLGSVLSILELPRSTWYYNREPRSGYVERYAQLRPVLEEIAREHTEYG